jgi:hypothetical protein
MSALRVRMKFGFRANEYAMRRSRVSAELVARLQPLQLATVPKASDRGDDPY